MRWNGLKGFENAHMRIFSKKGIDETERLLQPTRMNFNIDLQLWKNLRAVELAKDAPLRVPVQVYEGHVCHYRECLGRFSNNEEAEKTLTEAGWSKDEAEMPLNYWKP